MIVNAKWLRIEEHTNAFDYLEKAKMFLESCEDNFYSWKWVMISLHGAIYGFAISACKGTNADVVIKKSKKGESLISFDEALNRCQESTWMKYAMSSNVLKLTDSQKESIRHMKNIFRNEFMHFKPKGWSIEIHDFPLITLDCFDVLEFLVLKTYNCFRFSSYKIKKFKSLIYQSRKMIKHSNLYKESLYLINLSNKK
ncbi:MAG: hypothetical protein WAM24_20475 [Ignavibacteriaceae bacterium]